MKQIRQKIKRFLLSTLIKEDDVNHLLFLYNKEQHTKLDRSITIGQLSSGILHDLFTPISSLSLMIEHFNNTGVLDDNELKDSLIESKDELNNLVRMIQTFLREDTSTESVCVSSIAEQSIRLLRHRAMKNKIRITFLRETTIKTTTNRLRLLQVIMNLTLNAINSFEKTNQEIKSIAISVYEDGKNIYISIHDNGAGISKKIMKDIYSPLFTTREEGLGLGLSITKKIITDELGGRINILSKEHEGTKVFVKIPKNTPKGVSILV